MCCDNLKSSLIHWARTHLYSEYGRVVFCDKKFVTFFTMNGFAKAFLREPIRNKFFLDRVNCQEITNA